MLGSDILEVAIGLVLLYSLLAMLVTTLRETIEALIRSRGRNLERAMQEMLGSNVKVEALYQHPLIYGLMKGAYEAPRHANDSRANIGVRAITGLGRRRRLPSYIPSRNFALALFDITAGGDADTQARAHFSLTEVRKRAIEAGDSASMAVVAAINAAQHDPNRAIAELENWYDSAMDRASGWYKRQTQWIILAIALVMTAFLNANSIAIGKYLYSNPGVREALVVRAQAVGGSTDSAATQTFSDVRTQLESIHLPIGTPDSVNTFDKWGRHAGRNFVGWLITAFAISLGAPFWFDLLNKFMVIRSTVKPREKSQEEGSEDRLSTTAVTAPQPPWSPLPVAAGAVPALRGSQTPSGPGAEGRLQQDTAAPVANDR